MAYLKVGIIPVGDIFDVKTNENGDIEIKGGLEAEFLNLLSRGLGVKFKYSIAKLLNINHQVLGNWTALISMVKYLEVDIGISKVSLTEQRSLQVNYSYPYTVDEMTFAIPIPSAVPNTVAFINPFTKNLWIVVITVVLVYPLTFQYFQTKKFIVKNLHMKFFGSLLYQNLSLKKSNRKQMIMIIFWLFGIMFLSLSYTTSLLSFMTVPLRERGIQTIPELAEAADSGNYLCAHLTGTGSYELFYDSNEPNLKSIGLSLKKNYIEFSPDKSHILSQMYTKKIVMIATRRDLQNLLYPQVYVASETFGILPLCIVFNSNFKRVNKLNEIIHRIIASGIYQKSVQDYMFVKYSRSGDFIIEKQKQPKQLSMINLNGAFLLFTAGMISSILTFVFELIYWKFIANR